MSSGVFLCNSVLMVSFVEGLNFVNIFSIFVGWL